MRLVRSGLFAKSFIAKSMIAFLVLATVAAAQDAPPPRFEVGGNLMAIRGSFPSVGPGVDGVVNFGRHLSLDASFDYLPEAHFQTYGGFFGAKAGIRRQRFGLFGKVRPGFFTINNAFRSSTINLDTFQIQQRFDPLTQRVLDLGGVVEFYPAQHWLLRWDLGDTMVFHEKGPFITTVGGGMPPTTTVFPSHVANNFQFSTGFHYRF